MSRFNFLNPTESAAQAEVLAAGRRDDDMATVVRAITARTTGKVRLKRREQVECSVTLLGTTPAGHELRANPSKQGIEIRFVSKPAANVLEEIKAAGWKWSRFSGVWYARDTAEARAWAKSFLAQFTDGAPAATSINPPPTTAAVIPCTPPPVAPAPSVTISKSEIRNPKSEILPRFSPLGLPARPKPFSKP
jgi:hypothetical protein